MTEGMNALVSVITPVFNAQETLEDTIQSVVAQTHKNWEMLLVIDAKSTDQSRIVAQSWSTRDSRVRLVESSLNQGVAMNRNRGLQLARGSFVALLDADDLWRPEKLERQLAFMIQRKLPISCHSYQLMSWDGKEKDRIRSCRPICRFSDLLKQNTIGCLTVVAQTDFLRPFLFKHNTPHEDFVLWLEILQRIPAIEGLEEVLADYRVRPHSRSSNKVKAAQDRWNIYRHHLGLNWLLSTYYLLHYVWAALKERGHGALPFDRRLKTSSPKTNGLP